MSDPLRDRISRALSLERVIGHYLPLLRQGSGLVGVCPFHDDRHPSLHVHVGKQFYKCFACGEGGDLFSFVRKMEGCSFPEALAILSRRYGILGDPDLACPSPVPRPPAVREEPAPDPLRARAIRREHEAFLRLLTPFVPPLEPLRETYRRFGVGVAPAQVPFAYTRLAGRMVFPLRDGQGQLCAFAGRWIGGERPAREPKYYNSPASEVYEKSRYLYALGEAAEGIRRHGFVYVTEGYKDALAMHAAGFPHTVAICGVAFTAGHAESLGAYTRRIVFLLDADRAGEESMARLSAGWAGKDGWTVSRAQLPYGHDPDSLLASRGVEAFREVIVRQTRVARLETYEAALRSGVAALLDQLRLCLVAAERVPFLRALSILKRREARVALRLGRNVVC